MGTLALVQPPYLLFVSRAGKEMLSLQLEPEGGNNLSNELGVVRVSVLFFLRKKRQVSTVDLRIAQICFALCSIILFYFIFVCVCSNKTLFIF